MINVVRWEPGPLFLSQAVTWRPLAFRSGAARSEGISSCFPKLAELALLAGRQRELTAFAIAVGSLCRLTRNHTVLDRNGLPCRRLPNFRPREVLRRSGARAGSTPSSEWPSAAHTSASGSAAAVRQGVLRRFAAGVR